MGQRMARPDLRLIPRAYEVTQRVQSTLIVRRMAIIDIPYIGT